jgi:two-component system response regulator GlrR
VNYKKGLFVEAHKGTFFLDEISEMPLTMQTKLLRVLEEREFYPLGASKTIKVNTRIITASNRDLAVEVDKGRFRKDLFYRVHVILIKIPPLRERKEDIPLLAKHFLNKYSELIQKDIKGFSSLAIQKLLHHSWPGNVRELENTVESAVALAVQNKITDDLVLPKHGIKENQIRPLKQAKDDFLKDYLVQLIELTNGNVSQAAKLAGKYRADLYELLKKYKLNPADFRS